MRADAGTGLVAWRQTQPDAKIITLAFAGQNPLPTRHAWQKCTPGSKVGSAT
jgi:hypothetical protein